MWETVPDRLARVREVVALDLPGFGDSPPLRETPSVEALARAVTDFLGELGLDGPHAGGNPLGGGIAIERGRQGGGRAVCVLSSAGLMTMREAKWARRILMDSRRV